jgi:stage II sporulation protein M
MMKKTDVEKREESVRINVLFILLASIILFLFNIYFLGSNKYLHLIGVFLIFFAGYLYFFNKGDAWGKSWKYFSKSYIYFLIAFGIFFTMALVGYFFPDYFTIQIIDMIKELVKETEGLRTSDLIIFIFLNNLKSAFLGMILGIFFGIFSFFVLVVNGYVIGFVSNKTVALQGYPVLWKLVPHGIFEIPAIMISVGLGMRLGMFIFLKNKGKNPERFFDWMEDSLRVFLFIIVPLLIIAAIIEGTLMTFLG